MKVTAEWLRERQACESVVREFARHFPGGVFVSSQSLFQAVDLGLNVDWFASKVLQDPKAIRLGATDILKRASARFVSKLHRRTH